VINTLIRDDYLWQIFGLPLERGGKQMPKIEITRTELAWPGKYDEEKA
jgi:hypothetical protein